MLTDPDVQACVDTFQLGLPRTPAAGRTGELLGRGTGSSLEFQEFRQYMPGDDIRHLDWAAYARTDTLMVRLYREEISPRTEILLDASRSMITTDVKSLVARQLAAMFALMSGRLGGRPSVLLLEDGPCRALSLDGLTQLSSLPMSGGATMPELLTAHHLMLKPRAVRIVVSDFLFPHDPETLVRRLAGDASALWLVQVLSAWEDQPTSLGGRRMIDAETSSESDIVIDSRAIATYTERLTRLRSELLRNCRRVHALFATVIADRGLREICRDDLCAAGMLRVG